MIQCVPKSWGFAHVCEVCGAVGPIVGDYPAQRDACEAVALGHNCTGETSGCLAAPLKGPVPRPVTDTAPIVGASEAGAGFAIAAIPGTQKDEWAIHGALAKERENREWFRNSHRVVAAVRAAKEHGTVDAILRAIAESKPQ
jgi:hypothetical protein